MEPVFDINKICRVCLEEGILLSIYSNEYAISPLDMIVACTNVKASQMMNETKTNSINLPLSPPFIFKCTTDYRRR